MHALWDVGQVECVLVKDEAVQKTGSFKARGPLNRLLRRLFQTVC